MATLGLIIMILGGIVAVIGNLWWLVAMFSSGFIWGIGGILFSPIYLVWLVTHWHDGKIPFCITLVGMVVFTFGAVLKFANEEDKHSAYDSYSSSSISNI